MELCPECQERMKLCFRRAGRHHGFEWYECSPCDVRTADELDVDEAEIDRRLGK